MNKALVGMITSQMLASCSSTEISFDNMNDMEIALYNSSVGFTEQVYCTEDVRIGSHIRKRSCATLEEMQDYNANQVGVLNTAAAGYGVFR